IRDRNVTGVQTCALPIFEPETEHTCAPIYQADRRTLLFRVVHHRRRVSLEVFHALSDGTGALWFLTDLLDAYVRRRFPEECGARSEERRVGQGGRRRPQR